MHVALDRLTTTMLSQQFDVLGCECRVRTLPVVSLVMDGSLTRDDAQTVAEVLRWVGRSGGEVTKP